MADLNAFKVLKPRRMLVTRAALDALTDQARSNGKDNRNQNRPARKAHDAKKACTAKAATRPSRSAVRRPSTQEKYGTQLWQPKSDKPKRLAEHLLLAPTRSSLRPLVTEKGMHRSTRHNAYAFEVNKLATKDDVRRAVEELFNVKVLKVHTQNRKGKPRRSRFRTVLTGRLEEGDREARRRASDRLLLNRFSEHNPGIVAA